MTRANPFKVDPKLDLVLERVIDVPPEMVWKAWTTPEQLMQWFAPVPWKTVECEIDLRPGGLFRTVMQSPEGGKMPNVGCYLEVVQNVRLVWTDAMGPGFRPAKTTSNPFQSFFTAIISLEASGEGTQYTATAIHTDAESRNKHEEMGFQEGWGAALDQLVAMIKKRKA